MVGVFVRVGVLVMVRVRVTVGVRVGVRVTVGVGVIVRVLVTVGVFVRVREGVTVNGLVGVTVGTSRSASTVQVPQFGKLNVILSPNGPVIFTVPLNLARKVALAPLPFSWMEVAEVVYGGVLESVVSYVLLLNREFSRIMPGAFGHEITAPVRKAGAMLRFCTITL
jgi:hypothetical protein